MSIIKCQKAFKKTLSPICPTIVIVKIAHVLGRRAVVVPLTF